MLARPEKGVENGGATIVGASAFAADKEGDDNTYKVEEGDDDDNNYNEDYAYEEEEGDDGNDD